MKLNFTAFALLLSLSGPSYALTTYCVGNEAQLTQALDGAQASSDSIIAIKLRQGTYDAFAASKPFAFVAQHSNQTLYISGGWSGAGGACTSGSVDASATQIVGPASAPALSISTGDSNGTSGVQVYLHDLSITTPDNTTTANGACLVGQVNPGNQMFVERVQIHECVAMRGSFASAYLRNNAGMLSVRDVVARNGLAANSGGIGVTTYNGGTTNMAQISITNAKSASNPKSDPSIPNGFRAGIVLAASDAASAIHFDNSVVWDNSGYINSVGNPVYADDIVVSGNVYLTRAHYATLKGMPAANVGASSDDPGFVAPGDPHLRPDSILIDSGVSAPAGGAGVFDAEGHTRVQGMALDVGAFEATPLPDGIFKNGFQ